MLTSCGVKVNIIKIFKKGVGFIVTKRIVGEIVSRLYQDV